MSETETIADIVAEIGEKSDFCHNNISTKTWEDWERMHEWLLNLRSRIEAAAKRERESLLPKPDPDWEEICEKCHDGEEPQDCEYFGEPDGCNSPIIGEHPYMPRGNGLKMRAALVQVELFLSLVERHGHPTLNPGDKCVACQGVEELRALVCKTLAAPARNCDVYDHPYDAADAWPDHEMCAGRRHQKGSCDGCTYQPARCVAKWMYAKAEEKRGDESPRTQQESEARI